MAIDPVVNKYRLGKEPTSAEVWKEFSHLKRIEALESIRTEYHRSQYGIEPRLQRVFRITQQTQR